MKDERCETRRFWEKLNPPDGPADCTGYCRRFPAQFVDFPNGAKGYGSWLKTFKRNWCGEWEPKDPHPPTLVVTIGEMEHRFEGAEAIAEYLDGIDQQKEPTVSAGESHV